MIRLMKIFAVLLTLFVIAMLALPQFLSTIYVKKRVANQLSELTGRPVSIQGESSITLQPYLTVSYTNVLIEDTKPNSVDPLLKIDTLRARLDVLSALRGEIILAEVALVRPQFNFTIEQDGGKNWHTKNGAFAERLTVSPDEEPKPLPLGNINIIDGKVTINDKRKLQTEKLTDIDGQVTWPGILRPANLELTAVWRGENFVGKASVVAPFELFRGGNTELNLSINSSPIEANFSGTYNSVEQTAIGELSATSPSLKRLSEWLHYPITAADHMGNGTVSGEVSLIGGALEFPDSEVTIGNHNGKGRLQFFLDEKNMPSVNGTLAFDTLDLKDLTAIPWKNEAPTENTLDLSALEGIRLDLRISANEVSSNSLEMQNLAASIIIRDGNATFDIGNADTLGGGINGSLGVTVGKQQTSIDTNILFQKIDLEAFVNSVGGSTITPNSTGDVTVKLKSKGTNYVSMMKHLIGEVSLQGKQGALEGINLPEILDAIQPSPDITWSPLTGTTSYDELDIKIIIENGVAFLRGSRMQGDGIKVALGGRTDLTQGNLALRGIVYETAEPQTDKPSRSLSFFVGGTASSPLFVPLQTTPITPPLPSTKDNL